MNNNQCSCGANEGNYHVIGCEYEYCPFCGEQLAYCDCSMEKLGVNCLASYNHPGGLSTSQRKKWLKLLNKKGRLSWILYPQFCSRCAEPWPDFFMVSNKEWEKYIEPDHRNDIICRDCYKNIKKLIDKYNKKPIKRIYARSCPIKSRRK